MLVKQLFDQTSSTYTYIIASSYGSEGIIIDPVDTHMNEYCQLINELDLKLLLAIDTHTHADHISARCPLHHHLKCEAVMGEKSNAECVTLKAKDGEIIHLDKLNILPIYTPGHTDDSYSFLINQHLFTGDTLLIRGTGRTDFQNGDAAALYDSITERLFTLPESTIVYPGHDYHGRTSSSIYEEIRCNPRIAAQSKLAFMDIMNQLNLPSPVMIDAAVPSNLSCRNQRALHKEHE